MTDLTKKLAGAAGMCFGLWLVPSAAAHGDLHEQIDAVTKQIEAHPGSAQLYLQRAGLHQAHGSYDAALADIERADARTNGWPILHLARARLFLAAEWFESAKVAADRFLQYEPNHAEALTTRARAKVKLGERRSAAEDFARAITNSSSPAPELFLECADALSADGTEMDAALRALEQGIARLGPLVTLEMAAVDLQLKQQQTDAALARLDRVIAQAPRKETWLTRRGDILRQANRRAEAVVAYQDALKALEALPPTRRAVPAMAELEQRIRTGMAEVSGR